MKFTFYINKTNVMSLNRGYEILCTFYTHEIQTYHITINPFENPFAKCVCHNNVIKHICLSDIDNVSVMNIMKKKYSS